MCLQVFLKGKAKRHADVGSKATPVADFVMEGNRNVTYGKIVHQVGCKPIHRYMLNLQFSSQATIICIHCLACQTVW